MASPSTAVTGDTPITLKINYKGVTRKFKLPLRELVASSLETTLRAILDMRPDFQCHFERYSDSAGSYVILDRTNNSVYKQLYRAAKAKQKLKLRVVDHTPPPAAPKPARTTTVEDVPETDEAPKPVKSTTTPVIVSSSMASQAPAPSTAVEDDRSQIPAIPGCFPIASSSVPDSIWDFDVDAHLNATLQNMARNHELLERNIARLGASVAQFGRKSETPDLEKAEKAEKVDKTEKAEKAEEKKEAVETAEEKPAAPQPIPAAKSSSRVGWFDLSEAVQSKTGCPAAVCPATFHGAFSVCCNSCECTVPDTHYHCSTCQGGDFDLCQACVDLGITCYDAEHWLIKRYVKDGTIINSTTERVAPKPKAATRPPVSKPIAAAKEEKVEHQLPLRPAIAAAYGFTRNSKSGPLPAGTAGVTVAAKSSLADLFNPPSQLQIRTCNNCIRELPEAEFLHCTTCYDFDLCKECFAQNDHGHHPKHAFVAAVEGTQFGPNVKRRMAAGRGQRHNAVCDGCEKFITGVRHKCMICPDWDYCSDCVMNADFIHPNHRFVPVYEPLSEVCLSSSSRAIHSGIYCDGPHCNIAGRTSRAIVGDRYKCAVCHNTDFCANCEASPANTHNKTHPLIKFKTPVRHVSVTTTGEHDSGRLMPAMGDRHPLPVSTPTMVKTVVDVKPEAPVADAKVKEEFKDALKIEPEVASEVSTLNNPEPAEANLDAMFARETVADGTVLPPNHVFQQTWVLRNTGSVAWPAGCCVRFVSGDYMGHVDPNHPAGIQELVSASESTICYEELAPGAEFPFTVLLRTPSRLGKTISYWRMTSKGGIKFGDRLWCDVIVQPKEEETTEEAKEETKEETIKVEEAKEVKETSVPQSLASSTMIFPKLDKESPASSVHQPFVHDEAPPQIEPPAEINEPEDWDNDSYDGFLTDDEYDILDASDEEYLEDAVNSMKK